MRCTPRLLSISLALLLGASCGSHQCSSNCSSPKQRTAPSSLLAPENERGVIGGPVDDTAFEFEPEPAETDDAPPRIEGAPPIPAEIHSRLAPYLASSRTRVAAAEATSPTLLVLARTGRVVQVHRVQAPGAPLVPLTRGPDPVAQVALLTGKQPGLLVRRDDDGNERHQLYRVSLDDGREQRLTDGTSRHGPFRISKSGVIAFTNNARDDTSMDIYLAPARGAFDPRLLSEREGQWVIGTWGPNGERLTASHVVSPATASMHIFDTRTGTPLQLPLGSDGSLTRGARFGADDTVYVASDAGGDFLELHAVSLSTGKSRSLTADIPWDVTEIAISTHNERLVFTVNEDGRSRFYTIDLRTGARTAIDAIPRGVASALMFIGKRDLLAFTHTQATRSSDAYTYDFATGEVTRWTQSDPPDIPIPFVEPGLVRVASFDGVQVPVYEYRPAGDGPFPALLWIHGGPEEQHQPAFDPIIQYYVSRGIAVLAPNIRGSDGYGRRYRALDDGRNRPDAIRDIGAILDWIEAQPHLDGERVGIFGGSYGGYVVLASLVAYSERFAAGCDLVGVSDFVTFLENTGPYRRDQRRAEYGDERDPEMRAFLREISPLTHAAQIRAPLMVAHGANDPRVPVGEARQIADAVRNSGIESWLLIAPDEGHGFKKRDNRDIFYAAMAHFFETHLLPAEAAAP